MNHKIEVYSNNDSVETCAQMADLLERVAAQLRARGKARVYYQRNKTFSDVPHPESVFFLGRWRIPEEYYDERLTPTPRDRVRLQDGASALAMAPPDTKDIAAWRAYVAKLGEAVAGMQSLDDLGEEANRRAWDDLLTLEAKWRSARDKLGNLEARGA